MADDLLAEVQTFIQESEGADSYERDAMLEDLRFVYSEDGQWDKDTRDRREGRPCYTFNRLIGAVNQVVGDQQQARPQLKIRGVDDDSDPELAEVFSGLIRNIEDMSDANSIYDGAFKFAVAGGYGAWRIMPEFRSEKSFEQEIFIRPIYNPMTVFWDPVSQDPLKRDQNSCAVAVRISKKRYEALYGEDQAASLSIGRDKGRSDWVTEKEVRIAEYWKRTPRNIEIALMNDGRVIELDAEAKKVQEELDGSGLDIPTVVKTRKTKVFQITWWKVDAANILEGPIVYDWKHIPVVRLPGRHINIAGRHYTQSLVRHSKDAQRMYNYDRTSMSEAVGNTPRAPYMLTAKMVKGYEQMWKEANAKNRPYLLYTADPDAVGAGGVPKREAPPDVPQALVALAALDSDDIKATTGQFDASLGERGPAESGEAIRARQLEGDVGSFEFMSNLAKALKFTGEILVDMIPKVYDTERTVRVLGLDGQEDFVKINAYDEASEKKLDLSAGRYDVSVTIGPSYSTQRKESLTHLLEASEVLPMIAEIAPDLIVKALDVPDADQLEKRVRRVLIAKGVIEPNEDEQKDMKPQEPDPVEEALVATEDSKAKRNMAAAAKDIAATEKTQGEIKMEPLELQKAITEIAGLKLDNQFKSEEIVLARKAEGEQVRVIADD